MSIFVQIASYRDPQLKPTLKDLLDKADNPEDLVISIAWQHSEEDEWDNLDEYQDDPRFKIIDIDYKESKGACWARWKLQQQYNGEDYTLQLDSHHRFIEGWDTELIRMYQELEKTSKKPLITSYIPSFDPENDPKGRTQVPWGMKFDRFTPEGVVFFLPYTIENRDEIAIPGRFYSAHFAFTTGKFVKEVPHDPKLYFHGEEISIAVRAYTWGYDIYHPNKVIAWHEYTRKGRTKHWDNHKDWNDDNLKSHSRMRQLLGVDEERCTPCTKKSFKGFDLGEIRTQADYEEFAGIRFSDRAIKQSTLDNQDPGLNPGEVYNPKFKHAIDLHGNDFEHDDYSFAAIIFEEADGTELYRKDEDGKLFQNRVNKKDWFTIWREANVKKPDRIVVWAHSESKGWAERKVFDL
jgi:hypothetical protein